MTRLGMTVALILVVTTFAGITVMDQARSADVAPDFELVSTGWENGQEQTPVVFRLSDYRGKTVVLDLMAVSCLSCRFVTRDVLVPLHETYGARDDFVILSVDAWADSGTGAIFGGETRETLVALQKSEGVPWRHALDTDDVWIKYNAISLPRVVVLDAQGHRVYDHLGTPQRADVEAHVAASLAKTATPVAGFEWGLYGLAALAGLAAVLTPCSIGLLPAYFGMLLGRLEGRARMRPALGAGAKSALGIIMVYAGLGLVMGLGAAWLAPHLIWAGLVVGVGMLVLGVLAMLGRGFLKPTPHRPTGFVAFGMAYGVAAFGCTGPLFLPLLLAGFLQHWWTGLALFVLYAAAVAFVLMLVAMMTAAGLQGKLRFVMRHARRVQWVTGALVALAGVLQIGYTLNLV